VQYHQNELLPVFEMPRSSYNHRRKRAARAYPAGERLKAAVIVIHTASRGAAGARTISGMLSCKVIRTCHDLNLNFGKLMS